MGGEHKKTLRTPGGAGSYCGQGVIKRTEGKHYINRRMAADWEKEKGGPGGEKTSEKETENRNEGAMLYNVAPLFAMENEAEWSAVGRRACLKFTGG